jgi:protein tyrosine phosphatase
LVESIHGRKLQNATPKQRLKFIKMVYQHYQQQNIFEWLQNLRTLDPKDWNQDAINEFEKCDRQHINGMLAAEKQIAKMKNQAWSPKLGAAISKKSFLENRLLIKNDAYSAIRRIYHMV